MTTAGAVPTNGAMTLTADNNNDAKKVSTEQPPLPVSADHTGAGGFRLLWSSPPSCQRPQSEAGINIECRFINSVVLKFQSWLVLCLATAPSSPIPYCLEARVVTRPFFVPSCLTDVQRLSLNSFIPV